MGKKGKIVIALAVILGLALVGVGIWLGMGYYRDSQIRFAVNDTLSDGGGQKVTVILLGGQSNASGCSIDAYLQQNVSREKYAEYQNGYDNVYINYLCGNNRSEAFVKCTTLQGEPAGCFGPELGLAEKLHEAYPDRMFFIIKCAWGGTNLYDQWLSPASKGKTGQLYKEFSVFVETSLEYLKSKNYDVTVAGMCWMQGESDSFSPEHAENYEGNLSNFVSDVRKLVEGYAPAEGMAFADAYIAENPSYWVYYEAVNRGKKNFAQSSDRNVLVDTVGHGLTCENEPSESPDLAHYDSMSQIKLGHLFAEALSPFIQ